MIRKTSVQTEAGLAVRVTFTLPRSIWADAIYLVGEFNDWQTKSHALRQDQTGAWTLSVDLAPNQTYPFFYLCTGQWMTDDHADGYIWDASGRNLFLVVTDVDAADPPWTHSGLRRGLCEATQRSIGGRDG